MVTSRHAGVSTVIMRPVRPGTCSFGVSAVIMPAASGGWITVHLRLGARSPPLGSASATTRWTVIRPAGRTYSMSSSWRPLVSWTYLATNSSDRTAKAV